MTALRIVAAIGLVGGPLVLALVLFSVRSSRRGRYLGASGPDDNYTAAPATPVRAALAIEAASSAPAAELARIRADVELPRFPKGGRP